MAPIVKKKNMRDSRLRWFSHVQRKEIIVLVRKSKFIQDEGTKKVEKNKKIRLIEVVKKMLIKDLTEKNDLR